MPWRRIETFSTEPYGVSTNSMDAAGREPSPSIRWIFLHSRSGAYFFTNSRISSSEVSGAMFPIQSFMLASLAIEFRDFGRTKAELLDLDQTPPQSGDHRCGACATQEQAQLGVPVQQRGQRLHCSGPPDVRQSLAKKNDPQWGHLSRRKPGLAIDAAVPAVFSFRFPVA